MFDNLKSPRQILQYNLFKGVTDWTNFKQFDYYEKGYPFLLVLRYPKFIELNLQYVFVFVTDKALFPFIALSVTFIFCVNIKTKGLYI